MASTQQHIERIRSEVPISRLLAEYGYSVRPDGGSREQQFSCDLHGDGRDGKPSARVYPDSASWYCVGTQERVLTDRGWIRLADIKPSSPALPMVKVLDGAGHWETPVQYIPKPGGTKKVVLVKTTAGYAVVVTPEHQIQTLTHGWVEARHLQVGDILAATKPLSPRFSQSTDLPVTDLNEHRYQGQPSLNLPTRWSLELGECLGYIFGDGWVVFRNPPASGMVGLTSHANDVEDARRVFHVLQDWAGGRGSEVHRTDGTEINGKRYVQDQYVFTLGNNGICEFFRRLGMDKQDPPHSRHLPESLWQAPEEGIRGFLRGVYATDGSVFRPRGRKGVRVNLYSVSDLFLKDVQLLLLQFGIHSRLQAPAKTSLDGKLTHPCWYLQLATGQDILQFRDRIGVANCRKQAILDSYQYNRRGSRPFRVVVSSVNPSASVSVADLSMPAEHSFLAGGITVHNCFACGISRDAIDTVQAKEGLSLKAAIRRLEDLYHLPDLPWEDEDTDEASQAPHRTLHRSLDADKSFEDQLKLLYTTLGWITKERALPLSPTTAFWEAVDQISYRVKEGDILESKGRMILSEILRRLDQLLEPSA